MDDSRRDGNSKAGDVGTCARFREETHQQEDRGLSNRVVMISQLHGSHRFRW